MKSEDWAKILPRPQPAGTEPWILTCDVCRLKEPHDSCLGAIQSLVDHANECHGSTPPEQRGKLGLRIRRKDAA